MHSWCFFRLCRVHCWYKHILWYMYCMILNRYYCYNTTAAITQTFSINSTIKDVLRYMNQSTLFITTPDELKAFCAHVAQEGCVAIDTEFIREKTYYPQLCLIQMATHTQSAVVDPLACSSLCDLACLLEDKSIIKVFFACSQDIEVLYDALGVVPKNVFDAQLAAAFLGYRYQLGYGALVEAMVGVHLPKTQALTDWSLRPLTEEQLKYAADDVIYQPQMYTLLVRELTRTNRYAWFTHEMKQTLDDMLQRRDPAQAFRHIKRVNNLTRKQLAIAKEVALWRDDVARARNVPRKWILSDEVVIELCKLAPTTKNRALRIRSIDTLSNRDLEGLLAAIARGAAYVPEDCPQSGRKERPSQDTESVLDLMYALLRIIGAEEHIATQLVASRDDLFQFLKNPQSSKLLQTWRYDIAGARLQELLAGTIGLTVKDNHVELV